MNAMPTGALTPFFDRFLEQVYAPAGERPTPVEALQQSLGRDLSRLFNVRNSLTIAQFLEAAPTSLDYGLPDTLGLSAQSATDLLRWEQVILRAIALYEPRLIQVRVAVAPDRARAGAARVAITGLAAIGQALCQFHFDTALDERTVRPATLA